MQTNIKKYAKSILVIIIGIVIVLFFIDLYKLLRFEQKGYKNRERQFSELLGSYYSTFYQPPKNINELKDYFDYLNTSGADEYLVGLNIDDNMNVYYDTINHCLYLYHFGLNGVDNHMQKYIEISKTNKLTLLLSFGEDIVLGRFELFDICNNTLIFKAFFKGYPINNEDTLSYLIDKLKPAIDLLQVKYTKKGRDMGQKASLIKSKYKANGWESKFVCFKSSLKSTKLILNKVNHILDSLDLQQNVDDLYFPIFSSPPAH